MDKKTLPTNDQIREMSGPEMIEAYNNLLKTEEGKFLQDGTPHKYKEVTRFADTKTGITRLESLTSSIRAVAGSTRKEPARDDASAKKARVKKEKKPATARKSGIRKGQVTNRSKLKDALLAELGKPVSVKDLCKKVYGSSNKEFFGPLNMVIKGLKDVDIKGGEFPYKIEKTKADGERFWTLTKR